MRLLQSLAKQLTFIVALMALALPSHATTVPSCKDLGMWTWIFASGLASGTDPDAACEEAWDDFASDIADSADYSISFGAVIISHDPLICAAAYYCKACRGYEADPVEIAPAPISPGDAELVARQIAPGQVVKIERHDGFEGLHIAYTVDVVGADGKQQVVVDGMTGQASLVSSEQGGSCQASSNP